MFSNFSRRQFFRLIGFSLAGVTAIASIPFIGKFFADKAQAQETASQEVYQGRNFRVVNNPRDNTPATIRDGDRTIDTPYDRPVRLFVDDREVDIIRNRSSRKFITYLLPFSEYNSAREVARALIELKVAIPNGQSLNLNAT
ncbi:hypothetical protein C7B80_16985 [Cyanosarcina cf. burmensis CCALA 770]|nr:hypothetical protein C7B80_16985 [Cyanosarcina cf. burmensis CCALA 770]